jgi:hypothetical protein
MFILYTIFLLSVLTCPQHLSVLLGIDDLDIQINIIKLINALVKKVILFFVLVTFRTILEHQNKGVGIFVFTSLCSRLRTIATARRRTESPRCRRASPLWRRDGEPATRTLASSRALRLTLR